MLKNVMKELKSLLKSFNKLHIAVKVIIGIFVLATIYKLVLKPRVLGFSFMDTLRVREGLAGQPKSLVYYRMDGCPHCKKFDGDWDKFKSSNTTSISTRKVDSNDPECQENGVQGFPTILLTDSDKKKIKECPTRDPDEMLKFCQDNE
tara:strand:- start:156 stop:599 length:444 start_codon:yes stop_codon:yes gene_type:complete